MSQDLCPHVQKTQLLEDYQSLMELRTWSGCLCGSLCAWTLAPLICNPSPNLLARRGNDLKIPGKSCCPHEDEALNCSYSRVPWVICGYSTPRFWKAPMLPFSFCIRSRRRHGLPAALQSLHLTFPVPFWVMSGSTSRLLFLRNCCIVPWWRLKVLMSHMALGALWPPQGPVCCPPHTLHPSLPLSHLHHFSCSHVSCLPSHCLFCLRAAFTLISLLPAVISAKTSQPSFATHS